MKKLYKISMVFVSVFLCVSMSACSKSETVRKTVFELPYYDGTEYKEFSDLPEYNSELWRRNDNNDAGNDPFILDNVERDGYYYRYDGFTASKSTDLCHWVNIGTIMDYNSQYGDGYEDQWAPEVVYENGVYYLFHSVSYPASDEAYRSGEDRRSLYVAVSSSPAGPFERVNYTKASDVGEENLRTINESDYSYDCEPVKYTLFEPIATNKVWAKILPERGFENSDKMCANIDPSPFVDPKDGKKYLLFNHVVQPMPIIIVEMENWLTPKVETSRVVARCGYYTVEDWNKEKNGETVEKIPFENLVNKVNEGPFMYYRSENDKYYLTYSVNGFADSTYSVAQAIGDSPTGPFRKLKESENGLILNGDNGENKKVSGTGHHCFFSIDNKLYICYHKHTIPGTIAGGRCDAIDEVKFVKIKDIEGNDTEVMYVNGPTVTPQPVIAKNAPYTDISDKADVQVVNGKAQNLGAINDGLLTHSLKLNQEFHDKYVLETEITSETTFEMTFDDYKTIRAIMIYNSKRAENIFYKIKNIEFDAMENGQPKTYFIRALEFDTKANVIYNEFELEYGNYVVESTTYCANVYAEFNEIKVNKIRFTVEIPEGQSEVGISEIAVLGRTA